MDATRIQSLVDVLGHHIASVGAMSPAVRFLLDEVLRESGCSEVEVDGLNKRERELVAEERWIDAIKELRSRRGLTLRDAKDVVDRYRARHPSEPKP